jgi:hypothetical protein
MRTAALSLLLCSLTCPSAFGAGRDLTTPVVGTAAYPASIPVVATNGNTFLTLWRMDLFGGGQHIYGSIADEDARLLTPTALRVVPFTNPRSMQLIATGSTYLAVWDGSGVAEISPVGKVLRTFTLPYAHRVAWNGRNFLLLYTESPLCSPCDSVVMGTVVDRDGGVIKRTLLWSGRAAGFFDVQPAGDDFILTLFANNGLFVERVSPEGEIRSPGPIALDSRSTGRVTTSSSGDSSLTVWTTVSPGGTEVWTTAIARDGTVLGRSKLPWQPAGEVVGLTVTPISGSYLIILTTRRATGNYTAELETSVMRIGADAAPLDGAPLVVASGSAAAPFLGSIAANNKRLYAVNVEQLVTGSRVVATSFALDNGLSDPRTDILSNVTRRQASPGVASDGFEFRAVWSDQTAETQAATTARVSRDGSPLDGSGRDLMRVNGSMGSMAIGYGAANYVVLWHHFEQLWAQRFTPSGDPVDSAPILLRSGMHGPLQLAVTSDGSRFFIVWVNDGRIFGGFLMPDGTMTEARQLSPDPVNAEPSEGHTDPDVAWDGSRFLLVWTSYYPPLFPVLPYPTDIQAIRLTADGAAIDGAAVRITATRLLSPDARAHVASNRAGEFLITTDENNVVTAYRVRGDSSALQIDSGIPIFTWWNSVASDVTWDGVDYVVAWQYLFNAQHAWLGTTRVATTGSAFSPLFIETGPPDFLTPPAVASNTLGDTFVVISEVLGDSARARGYFTNEMSPTPPPPSPPINVSVVKGQYNLTVTWQTSSTDESGFLVESRGFVLVVPANTRSATISPYEVDSIRVQAFNEGGLSEPSAAVPVTAPSRRRAAHP